MKIKSWKSTWPLVAMALLAVMADAPQIASGQKAAEESGPSAAKAPAASKKITLSDVTRVSTEAVVRQAAKEKAKDGKSSDAKAKDDSKQKEAPAPAVTELKPSAKSRDDAKDPDPETAEVGGNRRLEKVHGSVQGVTGPATRAGSAEIGVGSKSGKTHVYVKTERSRTDTPEPH